MKDHYQVKFVRDGNTIYGIVDQYSDEAKKYAKSGQVVVEDAVLPVSYTVPESEITDIELRPPIPGQADELHQYVERQFDEAMKLSDTLTGVKPGKLFAVGVADGAAYYVVTKVTKNKATVEWRGFCPDRWTDHWFGWGKTVPIQELEHYCRLKWGDLGRRRRVS
jgi:dienelactone hydrolase